MRTIQPRAPVVQQAQRELQVLLVAVLVQQELQMPDVAAAQLAAADAEVVVAEAHLVAQIRLITTRRFALIRTTRTTCMCSA